MVEVLVKPPEYTHCRQALIETAPSLREHLQCVTRTWNISSLKTRTTKNFHEIATTAAATSESSVTAAACDSCWTWKD